LAAGSFTLCAEAVGIGLIQPGHGKRPEKALRFDSGASEGAYKGSGD